MRDSVEIARFKDSQLAKIVMDEPWDTSLAWADAEEDLSFLNPRQRDEAVRRILIELLDKRLIYFFRVSDFGESYSRTPKVAEVLSRDDVISALGQSRESPVPFLGVRATDLGREDHFNRVPDDSRRWELHRRDPQSPNAGDGNANGP
jgi:hypothetical protein